MGAPAKFKLTSYHVSNTIVGLRRYIKGPLRFTEFQKMVLSDDVLMSCGFVPSVPVDHASSHDIRASAYWYYKEGDEVWFKIKGVHRPRLFGEVLPLIELLQLLKVKVELHFVEGTVMVSVGNCTEHVESNNTDDTFYTMLVVYLRTVRDHLSALDVNHDLG